MYSKTNAILVFNILKPADIRLPSREFRGGKQRIPPPKMREKSDGILNQIFGCASRKKKRKQVKNIGHF